MQSTETINPVNKMVVEISMEIAFPPEILDLVDKKFGASTARNVAMSTSVGGIGPLLRERIIAQANLGARVIGITLLYDRVWTQHWHIWEQMYLRRQRVADYIHPALKEVTTLQVKMYDGSICNVKVWQLNYANYAEVYFLDVPAINMVVYPGVEDAPKGEADPVAWVEESRRKQSWLLGRGALNLLKFLDVKPDFIVLSETPTIFGHHRLIQDEFQTETTFADTRYVFNDHTPMEYAHPMWTMDTLKRVNIDPMYYEGLTLDKETQRLDITQLLVRAADCVYGVSVKHGEIMRTMPSLQKHISKIRTITNGISLDIWQNARLRNYTELTDAQLLAIKQTEKERTIDWIWFRYKLWSKWQSSAKKRPLIVWSRRITNYKRLDLLTTLLDNETLTNRLLATDTTIILGGRIHQQDQNSRRIIFDLLDHISKYPELEERIVMLDNYNVWEAPRLFYGAEASIMISDAGREASATGFMKALVNAGLVIATSDGAVPESIVFYGKEPPDVVANGFEVEYLNNYPTPESFVTAVEQFRKVYDNPELRVKMMRAALVASKLVDIEFTARKMLDLYTTICENKIEVECPAPSPSAVEEFTTNLY